LVAYAKQSTRIAFWKNLQWFAGAAGKAGLNAAAGQPFGHSPWEYVLFGTGLIATVVVTVWVTRIARRELSKSEANQQ
jgi:hypothetical protein